MGELFNPAWIISRDDVPTFYCHGTRGIEFLDGGLARIWICEDQPVAAHGVAPMSKPLAIAIVPVACFVWNLLAQSQYAFDRGILATAPRGPVALRPSRLLMH